MPAIIVEYTEGISVDIPKLLSELHYNLAEKDTVNVHEIKTRAIPVLYTIVGDGNEPDQLIHIALKLLPGRSDDLRKTMAQGLFDIATKIVRNDRITITVETIELHAPSYTKQAA